VFFIMPFEPLGRPSVVAEGELSCGQVLLTQTFTGTPDPYFVLFYFRPSGANEWVEFYVDDESPYWRGSLQIAASRERCTVSFYGKEELAFRCGDRALTRRNLVATLPRGLVSDPRLRNYEERLDSAKAQVALEQYYWSAAAGRVLE